MDQVNIILEHSRLALEFSQLPKNAESPEAFAPIARRMEEIQKRIAELKCMEARWEKAHAVT